MKYKNIKYLSFHQKSLVLSKFQLKTAFLILVSRLLFQIDITIEPIAYIKI